MPFAMREALMPLGCEIRSLDCWCISMIVFVACRVAVAVQQQWQYYQMSSNAGRRPAIFKNTFQDLLCHRWSRKTSIHKCGLCPASPNSEVISFQGYIQVKTQKTFILTYLARQREALDTNPRFLFLFNKAEQTSKISDVMVFSCSTLYSSQQSQETPFYTLISGPTFNLTCGPAQS